MNLLELNNVSYKYNGSNKYVLRNLDYKFNCGNIYAIIGKSGAGKTTLLSILSSLAKPTEGQILLNGEDISKLDKYKFRSNSVGVIFQSFNLLTHLTALENVMLSMDVSSVIIKDKKSHAKELLEKVEIDQTDITDAY